MADNNYFRFIPDFQYITRGKDKNGSSDLKTVKNFFVRPILTEKLYGNITVFDRYIVEDDERPDTVAFKIYGDSNFDWVILLSNNILDVYSEWPLSKINFDNYLLEKYGSYEKIYETRYYVTKEIKNSQGVILIPEGLQISNQYIDFDRTIIEEQEVFDPDTELTTTVEVEIENPNYLKLKPTYLQYYDYALQADILYTDLITPVSNYDYELDLNEKKRQIFVLKKQYLSIIQTEIDIDLKYKEGSEQYVSETLKKAFDLEI